MKRFLLALMLMVAFAPAALASGRCDGFHGCRCGVTAARDHGLPLNYGGFNLKMAREWPAAFQRISEPVAGAVAFFRHGGAGHAHVATIVRPIDGDHAVVHDDRGTYVRKGMRHAVYLSVGAGVRSFARAHSRHRYGHLWRKGHYRLARG